MSSYTQTLYQIVFGTKYHRAILDKPERERLFRYMTGTIQGKKCFVHIINGVENHIHILIDLHPTIALSDLVRDIKISSSKFIREYNLFPRFKGWQIGYAAFTYSRDRQEVLYNYIKNQEAHHSKKTFEEEYRGLLVENEIDFDEQYLFGRTSPGEEFD